MQRVVIDPGVLVSVLIGKALAGFLDEIIEQRMVVLLSHEFLAELKEVAGRPKFKKLFPLEKVERLQELLILFGEYVIVDGIPPICRDPKDDYLLAMAEEGKADLLISGDDDLLVLGSHSGTAIMSPAEFKQKHL